MIPTLTAADYGRMGAAAIAVATDDREALDLALADAQRSGRSLEFVAAALSTTARACGLFDGPEQIEAFRQKIAQLAATSEDD